MNKDKHISIAAVVALLFIISSIVADNFMFQTAVSTPHTGMVTIDVVAPNAAEQPTGKLASRVVMSDEIEAETQ